MPFARVSALLAAVAIAAAPAAAATSPWVDADGAQVRLLGPGGKPDAQGNLKVGIEIALDEGWKTYWRHPGDAGIAPEFDFSASTNLAEARVLYPAPHRFDENGTESAGYKVRVVLPVEIRPSAPALPVLLAVTMHFGLCRDICVPATATARMMVSAATAADPVAAALVDAGEAAVPGSPTATGPQITEIRPDGEAAGVLVVTARLAEPEAPTDLFVEGPADAFPPLPHFLGREGDLARWRVKLDRHRPAPAGAPIRLTLVNGAVAVEEEMPLP